MNKNSKIYIAGHRGMVGSAIHRKLLSLGYRLVYRVDAQEVFVTVIAAGSQLDPG